MSKATKKKTLKDDAYQYDEANFLGQGSFARVYKGVIVKNQRTIAVRLLPLKLIKQYGPKIKNIINGQVSVLKQLSETSDIDILFTTKIYDCFLTDTNVVMILEYCPDGNLENVITKRGALPQAQALEIAYQLARGLQFISKRKVVHRDIKPDNIFIKKESGYTINKIGDFGFAVKKQLNDEIVGTPIFMSPQLFKEAQYGSQVDVWAYGLLVHYILFNEHYFIDSTEAKVKQKVLTVPYKLSPLQLSKISPKTADFLQKCLQSDKNNRLRAENLADHPAFNDIRGKVQYMMVEVGKINQLQETQLRKSTVKGIYISYIMSFNFIYDIALFLAKKNPSNLASLYILKFCLSELYILRQSLSSKQNVINHSQWNSFVQSNQFNSSLKVVEKLFNETQKAFETYYGQLMNIIANQLGPQVVQGINSNLGNGPYAPINTAIPIYELKNNWINKLGTSSEQYLVKLECLVIIALIQKKKLDIDFYALQITKKSAKMQEISQLFENALKKCV